MTYLEQRLEDVKRGYVLGDFSVEEFEDEVGRILAYPEPRGRPADRLEYVSIQIDMMEVSR